jgi:hypothetical protein
MENKMLNGIEVALAYVLSQAAGDEGKVEVDSYVRA